MFLCAYTIKWHGKLFVYYNKYIYYIDLLTKISQSIVMIDYIYFSFFKFFIFIHNGFVSFKNSTTSNNLYIEGTRSLLLNNRNNNWILMFFFCFFFFYTSIYIIIINYTRIVTHVSNVPHCCNPPRKKKRGTKFFLVIYKYISSGRINRWFCFRRRKKL